MVDNSNIRAPRDEIWMQPGVVTKAAAGVIFEDTSVAAGPLLLHSMYTMHSVLISP